MYIEVEYVFLFGQFMKEWPKIVHLMFRFNGAKKLIHTINLGCMDRFTGRLFDRPLFVRFEK